MSKMVLYTQPGCSQCRMIHTLLDNKKIPYDECQDLDKLKSAGGDHTPTLEINGKLLVGKDLFNFINSYRGK